MSILLRQSCDSGIITEDIPDIICLMFTEDIANCAETVIKLQQQLNIIETFCNDTGMEVNLNKTEIIVFINGGNLRNSEKWYFGGTPVNVVSKYKYM